VYGVLNRTGAAAVEELGKQRSSSSKSKFVERSRWRLWTSVQSMRGKKRERRVRIPEAKNNEK